MEDIAFVMFNRYLDITEMIEDPDNADLEDPDEFKCTDVPSIVNLRLPSENFVPEDQRQKLRDWCLKISMERNDEIPLPKKSCPNCSKQVFEVSYPKF